VSTVVRITSICPFPKMLPEHALELRQREVRRILLPRTRVNRPSLEAPGTPTPPSGRCHPEAFADTRAICNADDPRGIMQCMNAYSEDLRKKILEALSRGTTKSEAARTFGVSRSSVKRYAKLAEQGLPLAPKKRPGSKPKMDESATKLLETDVQRHPTATLAQRREFLQKVAGVRVSESTISRMLRRLGWSRKKGRWVRARETSS
jgi:transposase